MQINWIGNKNMKELLEKVSSFPYEKEIKGDSGGVRNLLNPPLKKVKDCIIISDKSVEILETFYDKAIEMYTDKTGYEASNTETRINDFFEKNISMEEGTKIALVVLEQWGSKLKQIEPSAKFCLIISCDEECVEIRFHKMHEGEAMWLDENLENYDDGAIGYTMI